MPFLREAVGAWTVSGNMARQSILSWHHRLFFGRGGRGRARRQGQRSCFPSPSPLLATEDQALHPERGLGFGTFNLLVDVIES